MSESVVEDIPGQEAIELRRARIFSVEGGVEEGSVNMIVPGMLVQEIFLTGIGAGHDCDDVVKVDFAMRVRVLHPILVEHAGSEIAIINGFATHLSLSIINEGK